MDEPTHVLADGTKVVTGVSCSGPVGSAGILVKPHHLEARRPNAKGVVRGWVSGHGGDVYWVQHEDESVGAYGFWEFELEEELMDRYIILSNDGDGYEHHHLLTKKEAVEKSESYLRNGFSETEGSLHGRGKVFTVFKATQVFLNLNVDFNAKK